jgi:hypothetical protein
LIRIVRAASLACVLTCVARVAAAQVPSPTDHLGRPLGQDFTLADWSEVSSYYSALAAASPHVRIEQVGESTEGRPFLAATISSEANLANLAAIRADAARIADPRGLSAAERARLITQGKVVMMISPAMHSNEVAGPQFGMAFAHALATSDEEPWATARERLVVVLLPCTNPDGVDHVVDWYRRTVGTPFEGAGMTRLYQRYAGHDNNRDWFMLSLAETRVVTRLLYSEWHPQVYWDVHQQGQRAERMFIPPYRDPLNPNLDQGIITALDALCSRALLDLTREGKAGIATGVTFDMWWNGGNRNVPVRHNVIGILTEAASADYGSPIFLEPSALRPPNGLETYAPSNQFPAPWPGGWWRIADIIDYEMAFGRSLLASLSREPSLWIETALEAAERSIARAATETPRAWILTTDARDRAALVRLIDVLLATGVELSRAGADFTVDGRTYPAGSIVIRRDQPYGQHVKDLFDIQRYPKGRPPYDVAGWTLPLLLGVRRVEVVQPLPEGLALEPIRSPEDALAGLPPRGAPLDPACGDTWKEVFAALSAGRPAYFGRGEAEGEEPRAGFEILAGADPRAAKPGVGRDEITIGSLPRIGLYDTWSGSMDEGWLRLVIERHGIPFVTVKNEMLRAGALADFLDVLVLPSISPRELEQGRARGTVFDEFAGGIDPEGSLAIEAFVKGGGTLIAIDGSCRYAIDLFGLPLTDATRGDAAKDFSCPGSVLRLVPSDSASRFTAGLEPSLACFFDGAMAFDLVPDGKDGNDGKEKKVVDVLARYAGTRLLLSGWIQNEAAIAGKAAWVRAECGDGAIHLFGFRPHYRSWTQQTFPLLFRALLFEER